MPQRRHRRQRVQNVAHGAQSDHKQTKLGLGVQALIFSQRRVRLSVAQAACERINRQGFVLEFQCAGAQS